MRFGPHTSNRVAQPCLSAIYAADARARIVESVAGRS
jgi:hypothetical protein